MNNLMKPRWINRATGGNMSHKNKIQLQNDKVGIPVPFQWGIVDRSKLNGQRTLRRFSMNQAKCVNAEERRCAC